MAKNIIHLETKLQESQINKVNIEAEQEELSSNIIKQNSKIIEESKDLEDHNAIIEKEVLVKKTSEQFWWSSVRWSAFGGE